MFRDITLRLVLTGLLPLLHQPLNFYHLLHKISLEGRVGFEVRSSKLDIGL